MRKFITRRLLQSVVILFIVSFLIYVLMRCMPTSYVESQARKLSTAPGARPYEEWLVQLKASYGLDVGIIAGYIKWLGKAIRLDFGDSWFWNMPVITKFSKVIWHSFWLGFLSLVIELVVAIPLGILSARKQYSKTDYFVTVFAMLGISFPSFFLATLFKWIFSVKLGWFDLFGVVGRMHEQLSPVGQMLDIAKHYVLPVFTLAIINMGMMMRYVRTNMLEVLNSDFIRTARAKGVSERRVVNHHAFRNTLIPVITLLGGSLPGLFSGALITETIFQIPGIGYTSYQSMVQGDIPFTMFYMLFLAVLTLLGTIIADILYAVVDPRVRVH